MKISCPSCSAKYSISDEKVVSRLAKIRCRKCGATIVIDGKVNPPSVTASTGGEPAEEHPMSEQAETGPEYSVDLGDGDQRTMPVAEIVAAYNAGQITGETYVWADGFEDWKALSEVDEIVEALHAAAGHAQAAPAPAASPWEAKSEAPPPQPSPVRAAARPARAAGSDLFGRIDRAGSEEDVATSAPEPGGLGGGGLAGATGARNESSVLFSLSALTLASASSPSRSAPAPRGSSTTASRDDSGLIDLKALTAAAVKSEGAAAAQPLTAAPAMSPLGTAPLGVSAPLGLGSPLGGGLTAADLASPQKSKTGLFIAIAIVAAAVIVALAVILRPAPPPPVVEAPLPPPPPAAAPTPTPTPTLTAAPPPTGSADDEGPDKPEKKRTTTTRRVTSTKKSSSSSGSSTSGGSEPAAAPAKPRSKCGCSSGDLQCAMRCAAKGG